MATIKEFFVYFLQGLDKVDFVKLLNNIIAFFKKYFVKDDAPAGTTDTTAAAK